MNKCEVLALVTSLAATVAEADRKRATRIGRAMEAIRQATRPVRPLPRWLCGLVLLAVAVVLFARWAMAAESRGAERLVPLLVPNRGTVRQEDDRFTILDAKGRRVGYGYVRPNGDIEVFNRDGSRRATIELSPKGQVRVRPPKVKR